MRVAVPGGPLAAVEALPAGAARGTVVLVPGFTGSKEDFRLVLEPLAAAGYRAVAYDQRGQYESPGPDDRAAYTVDALAGDLLALLAALGPDPAHLVGHSFGGLVSRAAVLRGASVRSLTLLGSGPAALTGPRAETLDLLRELLEGGGLHALADVMEQAAAADPRRAGDPPELRAFLRQRFLAASEVGLVAMADALLDEPDRVQELRAIGVPLLVAYGEQDDAWHPSVQAEMAQRLDARHVVIERAYHSPAVENPADTVAALLSFFDEA